MMKMRDIIGVVEGKIFETITETFRYNQQILDFLHSLGIDADIDGNFMYINRSSMYNYVANNVRNLDENDSYTYVLELIREQFSNLFITWSGRTDDWLGLSVYERNFSR